MLKNECAVDDWRLLCPFCARTLPNATKFHLTRPKETRRAQAQRWLLESADMAWWAAMADLNADRIPAAVRRGTIHRCAKRSRGERIAWFPMQERAQIW
jgi:predicted Fe-S protein YdhL (DUF1289 family)